MQNPIEAKIINTAEWWLNDFVNFPKNLDFISAICFKLYMYIANYMSFSEISWNINQLVSLYIYLYNIFVYYTMSLTVIKL